MISRLPQELVDDVIDELPLYTLPNSSLVARSWRDRSQSCLFSQLFGFESIRESTDYTSFNSRMRNLLVVTFSNPRLASFITAFALPGHLPLPTIDALPHLSQQLPNLHTLQIANKINHFGAQGLTHAWLTNIRALHLSDLHDVTPNELFSFLDVLTSLRVLSLAQDPAKPQSRMFLPPSAMRDTNLSMELRTLVWEQTQIYPYHLERLGRLTRLQSLTLLHMGLPRALGRSIVAQTGGGLRHLGLCLRACSFLFPASRPELIDLGL